MGNQNPGKAILIALRTFDSYASGVRKASYFFMELNDLPWVSQDAKVCVSMFLDRPELDLDYRNVESFTADVKTFGEWLSHIKPRVTDNDTRICYNFAEEEFTISLSLWK